MKILIVKMSAMGDVIHALPVLDYLHQAVPKVEIGWIVEDRFAEILEGNPLLSRLHLVRTREWRRKPFAAATRREISLLKQELAAENYELVFDIQGNLKSGLACWLSGVAEVVGFEQDELQERVNSFFTTRQIPVRRLDRHVTDKYLRVVSAPFGRDYRGMTLSSTIATSAQEDAAAEALLSVLPDGLVFLFQYGTTWSTKYWHPEGWVDLAGRLLEVFADSSVLFTWGTEQEREVVTALSREAGERTRVLDRMSLKGLAALLKRVDMVIGGDTGVVHLAAAVGTPTVSLYRSTDGDRSGPRGERHAAVYSPLSCARCFRTSCSRDDECRRSITVDAVYRAVEKLLS